MMTMTAQMPADNFAELAGASGKMVGKMKSFSYKSGYGFIHEVMGCDTDVYVGKDQLPLEWQLSEMRLDGHEVMFDVQNMPDGKMHAKNVITTSPPGSGQAMTGTVKSYNPHKGYGFFSAESLGEDVFFSGDRIPPEAASARLEGTVAVFNVQQKPDGKYEAYNIQLSGNFARSGVADKRGFSQFGGGNDHFAKRPRTMSHQPVVQVQPLVENTLYNGSIKSFREQTNYGFITSPHAVGDLRFHCNDVVNGSDVTIDQGQDVTFYARSSPDGRLQAYNVTVMVDGKKPALRKKRENLDAGTALESIRELLPTLGPQELIKLHLLVGQMMLGHS